MCNKKQTFKKKNTVEGYVTVKTKSASKEASTTPMLQKKKKIASVARKVERKRLLLHTSMQGVRVCSIRLESA